MAAAICPACKGAIDSDAKKCPHCGRQFFGTWGIVGVVALTLAVLFVVAAAMGVFG
jgi:RNA polymerase subunit RPABC4/transcription elongation factor Spt4